MSSGREGDSIVVYQLNAAGCNLSNDAQLKDFNPELFFKCCSVCVRLILPEKEIAEAMPSSSNQKFKAAVAMTEAVKECGFMESLDFNNFMYVDVQKMKSVLRFLVNRLPAADVVVESGDSTSRRVTLGERSVNTVREQTGKTLIPQKKKRQAKLVKVQSELAEKFVPCAVRNFTSQQLVIFPQTEEEKEAYQRVPYVRSQVIDARDLPSSFLEYNMVQLSRERAEHENWVNTGAVSGKSRAQWLKERRSKLNQSLKAALLKASASADAKPVVEIMKSMKDNEDDSKKKAEEKEKQRIREAEEEAKKKAAENENREKETQKLTEKIQNVRAAIARLDDEVASTSSLTEQARHEAAEKFSAAEKEAARAEELEANYETQKKTIEMASDIEGNRKRLTQIAAERQSEVSEIEGQFKEKARTYEEKYDAIEAEREKARRQYQAMLAEIKECKGRRKNIAQEEADKEQQKVDLEKELKSLPQHIDRNIYIDRIMDIIKNIKKQQQEIVKINIDNRELQKEINQNNDAVSRSFLATEEKIYSAAKDAAKDNIAKQVYKHLVHLRESFDKLVTAVQETGLVKQHQYELEEKKSKLVARGEGLNREQVAEDLASIRDVNKKLNSELKQLKEKV